MVISQQSGNSGSQSATQAGQFSIVQPPLFFVHQRDLPVEEEPETTKEQALAKQIADIAQEIEYLRAEKLAVAESQQTSSEVEPNE